ncbi:predicted protein [Pyrenophora tritici-repentis Pt-1C-BFP]|uniref:Uncharacterized protein n=1 Tax=Pyrenophora tritici-repentis (strain Pt-1C-BFP) TaxID=426418 RepID=B2VV19_PYRTR|nr:uncharacterized protein PTRG_02202 [Pyrenophora tritici-repentis Pt-1C-BFP]EDU41640.1 predicted protein [Pyrenophora tritici-repentis Pt-1C-BFP]
MSKAPLVWEWTMSVALATILVAADRLRTKFINFNCRNLTSQTSNISQAPGLPRALTESEPNPPVRDCAAWVAEVLEEVRTLLRSGGLAA